MATSALIPVQPVFLSKSDKERLAEMEKQRVAFNEQLEARKAALAQYNPLVERYNEQLAKYQEAVAPYNEAAAEYNRQLAARQAAVDEYNRLYQDYEKQLAEFKEAASQYDQGALAEYQKQLKAYEATFVPGEKRGELALVQKINGQLYDALGQPLPLSEPFTQYSKVAGMELPENVYARRTGGELTQAYRDALKAYQEARFIRPQLAYHPTKGPSYRFEGVTDVPGSYGFSTPEQFRQAGYTLVGDPSKYWEMTLVRGPNTPAPTPEYTFMERPVAPTYGGPAAPVAPVYAGPAEPVKPEYGGPAEPIKPVYTGPAEPVAPFTQESFEQFQQEAQGRAQQAAGQRALAADVYQDPSKFGLAGFAGLSARAFAKGGEVKDGEPRTKAGRMMKELGFSKAPKEKTLADEPSRQSPETLAYSLRAQSEANKDADLRRKTLAAPGALEVKRFQAGGEVMSPEEQPVVEESKASQALKELIRPVREGVKGYFGMDPESSGSEAYRVGQAMGNMPGVGLPAMAVAGVAKTAGKIPASKRLLLMPCSDMKCETPAEAKDLYKGVFYQTYRKQVQPGAEPHMMILSAKHGFVGPKQILEPYDQKMTPQQAEELARSIKGSLEKVNWPEGIEEVMLVGGKHYQRVMNAALDELKAQGKLSSDVSVRSTKGEIGEQRSQLGQYLREMADRPPEFSRGGEVTDFISKSYQGGGEVEGNEEVPQGPITTPLRTRTRRPATQEENESLSRAMLQGLANMPYNVVGIPGDIANLLAAPTGKQPFYGSESAKALATQLGIRPAPPTDPTAAALYGAADIGSSLINPAAPVRAAARGAERAGAALSNAAKGFQEYNRMLDVPGAAYAVKPKGGNWVDLERTLGLEKRNIMNPRPPGPDDSPFYVQNYKETVELDKSAKAINGWIDNKLTKYIRNNLGTTDDPVRAQLDRWELVEKPNLLSEKDRQIDKVMADIRRVAQERGVQPETLTRSQEQLDKLKQERLFIENQQGGFPFAKEDRPAVNPFLRMIGFGDSVYQQQAALARRQQGMPEAPLAKGDIAQEWEARSDTGIRTYPGPLMRELADPDLLKENPWLQKLGPDDKVYQLDSTQGLNLPHVVDELLTALSPASGLPKKLQITPEELANSSVEKVFKLVDDIGAFRAVQRAEADKALAGNIATVPVKNYATVPGTEIPDTDELRWVQLKIPQPRPNYKIPPHLEIVKPTPSSETWAIYDNNRKQYITSGLPSPQAGLEHLQYMEGRQALEDALKYEGRLLAHCVGTYCPDVEKGDSQIFSLRNAEGRPTATIELTREGALSQIKGQNNAPPRSQLPFVLDFLKEKNPVDATKGGLTDMHQMGIFHVTPNQRLPGFSKIIPPGFYTLDDFKQMALDNQMPEDILNTWMDKLKTLMKKGYAHGGPVNKHDAFIKAHA